MYYALQWPHGRGVQTTERRRQRNGHRQEVVVPAATLHRFPTRWLREEWIKSMRANFERDNDYREAVDRERARQLYGGAFEPCYEGGYWVEPDDGGPEAWSS